MNKDMNEVEMAYHMGFIAGLTTYAWWKDGVQQVGTTGTTLKQAIAKASESWNYAPPRLITRASGEVLDKSSPENIMKGRD